MLQCKGNASYRGGNRKQAGVARAPCNSSDQVSGAGRTKIVRASYCLKSKPIFANSMNFTGARSGRLPNISPHRSIARQSAVCVRLLDQLPAFAS
jgi:hypothetical protein